MRWVARLWLLGCLLLVLESGPGRCEQAFGQDLEEVWGEEEPFALDTGEVEELLEELSLGSTVSFDDLIEAAQAGDYSSLLELSLDYVQGAFVEEISENKAILTQVLLLAILFSILHNFADVFRSSQVSETGFFMVFTLLLVLLLKSFSTINTVVLESMENLNIFMRTLLPVFASIMVVAGTPMTAAGYGELTIFIIYLVELCMESLVMPLIHGYLMVQFLNYMTRGEIMTGFGDMVEAVARWLMRGAAVAVFGMSLIQNMMAPAVDRLKTLGSMKVTSMIPGIGAAADTVTQMVIGSGTVIKNGVGTAAVLVILFLLLVPLVKVTVTLFFYKLAAAMVEPLADKRICGILNKTAVASGLLLRMLLTVSGMFITTIALVVAAGSFMN